MCLTEFVKTEYKYIGARHKNNTPLALTVNGFLIISNILP